MKNLHKIRPIFTDRQKAHIWFIQGRMLEVRIINGVVGRKSPHWEDWRTDWWTTKADDIFIQGEWIKNGKPEPHLHLVKFV